jgi:hypothetical protein
MKVRGQLGTHGKATSVALKGFEVSVNDVFAQKLNRRGAE